MNTILDLTKKILFNLLIEGKYIEILFKENSDRDFFNLVRAEHTTSIKINTLILSGIVVTSVDSRGIYYIEFDDFMLV